MQRLFIPAFVFAACLTLCGHNARISFAADDDDESAGPIVYDKIYELKPEEFESQVIETEHFIINNLLLARARNEYDDKKMERVTFGASIKSRTSKSQEVTVMLAGFDDKKSLLWTGKSSDSLYGRVVESMNDQIRIPPGTLKNTVNIWMRVVVVTSKN